eukprot:4408112-Karenia_brevis.AAC.1
MAPRSRYREPARPPTAPARDCRQEDADFTAGQEHSVPPRERAAIYEAFREAKRQIIMGPLDPEVRHHLGRSRHVREK